MKELYICAFTSSSIVASVTSCSLPLPLAIFWASAICDRTAYVSVLVEILTSVLSRTYFCAEVFKRVALDSIYAELRIWLHYRKTSRYYSKTAFNELCSVKNPVPGDRLHRSRQNDNGELWVSRNWELTKELFGSTTLLDDFDQPGFQLLNGSHMVCKDAHLPRLGW